MRPGHGPALALGDGGEAGPFLGDEADLAVRPANADVLAVAEVRHAARVVPQLLVLAHLRHRRPHSVIFSHIRS
eukprot:8536350-Pyramimonas_sp.AAC.1